MLFIVSTVELKPWVERAGLGAHVDEEDEIAVTVVGGKAANAIAVGATLRLLVSLRNTRTFTSGAIRL